MVGPHCARISKEAANKQFAPPRRKARAATARILRLYQLTNFADQHRNIIAITCRDSSLASFKYGIDVFGMISSAVTDVVWYLRVH